MNGTIIRDWKTVVHFDWSDYSVFVFMLGVSVVIGIYFAICGRKGNTVDEYLLGGKNIKPLPIAFSLIASGISGITLVGLPTEVYTESPTYILTLPSILLVSFIAKYFFLPIYFDLKITSIYEYLEHRFDRRVRLLTSIFYNTSYILYMPAVIYVPSIALSQAIGINLHIISAATTFICVFYTMIGGMKAVVWTDFFQLLATLLAIFAIMIIGTINVGGLGKVFDLAYENGKLNIFNFDPSPFQRMSFWICTFGPFMDWMTSFTSSQSTIQRFLSLKSSKDAATVLCVYFLGYSILTIVSVYNGLLLYATYYGCDPIQHKLVDREDQIFPYFVLDKVGYIPALPGVFIAGVFSAALSTLSTGLNTTAGVIYEDFIKRHLKNDKFAHWIMKFIIIIIGLFCLLIVYLIENMGKILSVSYSITSIVYAPVGVLFLLGMVSPWSNSKGAICGAFSCAAIIAWISIGSNTSGVHKGSKNIYPEGSNTCPDLNGTVSAFPLELNSTVASNDEVFLLYNLSFMLYHTVGISTGIIVGTIVSFITGATDPATVNPKLICPPLRRFLPKKQKIDLYAVNEKLIVEMKPMIDR